MERVGPRTRTRAYQASIGIPSRKIVTQQQPPQSPTTTLPTSGYPAQLSAARRLYTWHGSDGRQRPRSYSRERKAGSNKKSTGRRQSVPGFIGLGHQSCFLRSHSTYRRITRGASPIFRLDAPPPTSRRGSASIAMWTLAGQQRKTRRVHLYKVGSVKPALMPGSCGRSGVPFHMEQTRREPPIQT